MARPISTCLPDKTFAKTMVMKAVVTVETICIMPHEGSTTAQGQRVQGGHLHAPGGGVALSVREDVLLTWGHAEHVSQAVLASLQSQIDELSILLHCKASHHTCMLHHNSTSLTVIDQSSSRTANQPANPSIDQASKQLIVAQLVSVLTCESVCVLRNGPGSLCNLCGVDRTWYTSGRHATVCTVQHVHVALSGASDRNVAKWCRSTACNILQEFRFVQLRTPSQPNMLRKQNISRQATAPMTSYHA